MPGKSFFEGNREVDANDYINLCEELEQLIKESPPPPPSSAKKDNDQGDEETLTAQGSQQGQVLSEMKMGMRTRVTRRWREKIPTSTPTILRPKQTVSFLSLDTRAQSLATAGTTPFSPSFRYTLSKENLLSFRYCDERWSCSDYLTIIGGLNR